MMKRSILVVLFAVCLVASSTAFATGQSGMADQSGSAGATRGAEDQSAGADATRGAQAGKAGKVVKADDLAGKKVQDRNRAEIGEIKSVAIDTSTGTAYALISMNDKLHPVPVSALTRVQDNYSLNIDKNRLAQAPTVTEDNMQQQLAQSSFSMQVHQFFGIAPPTGGGSQRQQR
ncbi:MAG: PRC-barrel domain-containing protein [Nitrospirota bacterium]